MTTALRTVFLLGLVIAAFGGIKTFNNSFIQECSHNGYGCIIARPDIWIPIGAPTANDNVTVSVPADMPIYLYWDDVGNTTYEVASLSLMNADFHVGESWTLRVAGTFTAMDAYITLLGALFARTVSVINSVVVLANDLHGNLALDPSSTLIVDDYAMLYGAVENNGVVQINNVVSFDVETGPFVNHGQVDIGHLSVLKVYNGNYVQRGAILRASLYFLRSYSLDVYNGSIIIGENSALYVTITNPECAQSCSIVMAYTSGYISGSFVGGAGPYNNSLVKQTVDISFENVTDSSGSRSSVITISYDFGPHDELSPASIAGLVILGVVVTVSLLSFLWYKFVRGPAPYFRQVREERRSLIKE